MKGKLLMGVVAGVMVFGVTSMVLAAVNETSAKLPPSPVPALAEVVPVGVVALDSSKYPTFDGPDAISVSSEVCVNKLKAMSGKEIPGANNFQTLNLAINEFKVPDAYKNSSKLLVSWTVRIEVNETTTGTNPGVVSKWTTLASYGADCAMPTVGFVKATFMGGEINTQLFVQGQPVGTMASITVPDVTQNIVAITPRDPTISGTYVLSKDDVDFSQPMNIEVRWQNDSAVPVVTKDGFRTLVITTLPITQDENLNK